MLSAVGSGGGKKALREALFSAILHSNNGFAAVLLSARRRLGRQNGKIHNRRVYILSIKHKTEVFLT